MKGNVRHLYNTRSTRVGQSNLLLLLRFPINPALISRAIKPEDNNHQTVRGNLNTHMINSCVPRTNSREYAATKPS